jgi:hypothetical protein
MDAIAKDTRTLLHNRLRDARVHVVFQVPISVELHAADASLVPIAKKGFPILPMPIQNMLLAIADYETEESKSIQNHTQECLQAYVQSLDNCVASMNVTLDSYNEIYKRLLSDARTQWKADIRTLDHSAHSLKYEVIDVAQNVMCSLEPMPDETWPLLVALDTNMATIRAACKVSRRSKIVFEKKEPDVRNIDKRLELSRAYREKATAIMTRTLVKSPDVPLLPVLDNDLQEQVVSANSLRANVPEDEQLADMCMRAQELRHKAATMWLPSRASMNALLQGERSRTFEAIKRAIDTIGDNAPKPFDLRKTKEALQNEFNFAVASFPCDRSLLKTCMTVIHDGARLAHTRTMLEMRTDSQVQVSLRMRQIQDALQRFEELVSAPTIL